METANLDHGENESMTREGLSMVSALDAYGA
jgi:hypothetical protein